MNATTSAVPTNLAASYLAFSCCLCTVQDVHEMVRERPLYAQAWLCQGCGHTVCAKHWMPCQRCYACCFETCLEHHWEKP